jgi:hypothetical protein
MRIDSVVTSVAEESSMTAKQKPKRRFNVETALAVVTAILAVVTLITREWIEALTGWDPDHGNGAVEWLIVAVLLVATVALGTLARSDYRRYQALPA